MKIIDQGLLTSSRIDIMASTLLSPSIPKSDEVPISEMRDEENRFALERLIFALNFIARYKVDFNDTHGTKNALKRLGSKRQTAEGLIAELEAHAVLFKNFKFYKIQPLLGTDPDGLLKMNLSDSEIPVSITTKNPTLMQLFVDLYQVVNKQIKIVENKSINIEIKVIEIRSTPDAKIAKRNIEDFEKILRQFLDSDNFAIMPEATVLNARTDDLSLKIIASQNSFIKSNSVFVDGDAFLSDYVTSMVAPSFNSERFVRLTFSDDVRLNLAKRLIEQTIHQKNNMPKGKRLIVIKNSYFLNPQLVRHIYEAIKKQLQKTPETAIYLFNVLWRNKQIEFDGVLVQGEQFPVEYLDPKY